MTIPTLDTTPTLFLLIGFAGLFLWILAYYIKPKYDLLFLGLMLLVFFDRLPTFLYNREINPDESQMLTQAMTLWRDPIIFRSVDTTTGGPLSSYLLSISHIFGFPFDYRTAHLLATLLIILSLWYIYRALNRKYSAAIALFSVLPIALFYAYAQHADFMHYSSELIAVVLLSVAFFLYVSFEKKQYLSTLFWAGLVLAQLPFAKLQSLPIGFAFGLMFLLAIFSNSKPVLKLISFVGGMLFSVGVWLALLYFGGALEAFFTYYIQRNLLHQSDGTYLDSLLQFPKFIFSFLEIQLLAFSLLVFILVRLQAKRSKEHILPTHFYLAFTWLMTIFALTKSGSPYGHYLHFMMLPLAWLFAILLIEPLKKVSKNYTLVFVLVLIAPYFIKIALHIISHKDTNAYPTQWHLPQTTVGNTIKKYAKKGEYLAIWGWRIDYHIETQMPQATNTNHNPYEILTFNMTQQHRKRYLADLQRNNPPVFVDAVGKNCHWFIDKTTQGHEIDADLKNYIQNHYILANFVDDTRIYVRKDRITNNEQLKMNN